MINRKILYGYQIQNGEITVVEDEALVVRRVFSLYLDGLSYQRISDTLNGEEIPFCREAPVWNKHKVKRLLENPRYAGRDGYPPILEDGVFRETQSHIRGKTAGYAPRAERPALRLKAVSYTHLALQRDDPAMLAVNRAIAQASEQSHRRRQHPAAQRPGAG